MFETSPQADSDLALLYARGELEGEDAAAFERRLGESQALRETLCRAVGLLQVLGGQPPIRPGRAYREQVRLRLRRRRAALHQHPALWAFLGAAVALLLLFVLPPPLSPWPCCADKKPAEKHSPPRVPRPAEDAALVAPDTAPKATDVQHGPSLSPATEDEDPRLARHEEDPPLGAGPPTVRH